MNLFDPARPQVNGQPGLIDAQGASINSIVPMPYVRLAPGTAIDLAFWPMISPTAATCLAKRIPQSQLCEMLDLFRDDPEKFLRDIGWAWQATKPAPPEIDLDDLLKDF